MKKQVFRVKFQGDIEHLGEIEKGETSGEQLSHFLTEYDVCSTVVEDEAGEISKIKVDKRWAVGLYELGLFGMDGGRFHLVHAEPSEEIDDSYKL